MDTPERRTLSCPIGYLKTDLQRNAQEKIYVELLKNVDAEEVEGLQLYPAGWPRKVLITFKDNRVKHDILRRGLVMFGCTVEMREEGCFMPKVYIKDIPVEISNDKVVEMLSVYGEVVRIESVYLRVEGKLTSCLTGERIAYMKNIENIPQTVTMTINGVNITGNIKCSQNEHQNRPNPSNAHADEWGSGVNNNRIKKCHSCGKEDHLNSDCPENKGIKENENVLVYYSPKCPLSGWSTEYPFKIDNTEYICTDQFILEEKCYQFGDTRTAKLIREETNPKNMRRIAENIRGYNHAEWMNMAEEVTAKALWYKFTDPTASGAREYLLSTGNKKIGEATRNSQWGTGLHISDPNVLDPNSWPGRNAVGELLMQIREDARSENTNSSAGDSSVEIIAPTSPPTRASSTPVRGPSRNVILFRDVNVADLPISDLGIPIKLQSYPVGNDSIDDIRKRISEGLVANDVDDSTVDIVALHLGTHEWDPTFDAVKSANSVFKNYTKLMNSICQKYQTVELVLSSIPLFNPNGQIEDIRDKILLINEEITSLNKKLNQLGDNEDNIHFVSNSGVYINPEFETLYTDALQLNNKGREIVTDNLKIGIQEAFRRDMEQAGLASPWRAV